MRSSLSLSVIGALAAFALAMGGCGGDSGSSSTDPASLAPADAPVFVEGTLLPSKAMGEDIDQIASTVASVDNLGELIVSELESSAEDEGSSFDYEKEVKPWLGQKAGVYFRDFDGDDLSNFAIAVQVTDADAARNFVEKKAGESDEKPREGSYEGVDYFSKDEGSTVGVVGDFLVIAEGTKSFEDAVDASEGDSLAGESAFDDAVSASAEDSLADVYVDVGALIQQGEASVDDQVLGALKSAGIDPRDATAVASIVPGSDQVEIDISSDLGEEEAPTGNASDLLGSLPGDSFAAFAVSDFGEQLQEALDELDRTGIPDTVPPNQLKKGVKELGIDLQAVADSLEDAAIFAVGQGESSLGGALVLTANGPAATKAVERAVVLVRGFNVGGVTVLGGETSGFAIHNDDLGDKPLVVAARDGRVAIGYGVQQTLLGLAAPPGRTLADSPAYDEAVASLEGTPISGFADGRGALRLADALVPSSEIGFQEAKPYLRHISFIAIGSGTEGDRVTARLVIGLEKK
jgi:hypothetical protein